MPDLSKFIWNRVQKEGIDITAEILGKIITVIGAGMSLVVALAWNTAIKDLFTLIFPKKDAANLLAEFLYAIIVTVLVVVVLVYLSRILKIVESIKNEDQEEEQK